jgi:hypothetical protein
LAALRYEAEQTDRWTQGGTGNRDPPLPGLRSGEELFTPRPEQVIRRLILDGVSPDEADAMVEKLWGFGWHDPDGVDVLTVFEERIPDLLRSGQWGEVLYFFRVHTFGGNDLAADVRDKLEVDHAQWIVGRLDAPAGTDSAVLPVRRQAWRVLTGVTRQAMLRRRSVPAVEVESRFGIPLAHQRILQRFADRYGYVIDVCPTNPDSVRWIQRGALPKPVLIKVKTIRPEDVWFGADPEYVGVVGFFDPVLPPRDDVPADRWDAVVERFNMRKAEYAQLHEQIAALGARPIGPGRFELGGRGNTVLFGYDAGGRRRPVTADHDLLDIRHANGRRLTPRELLEVVVELIEYGTGVQQGTSGTPRHPTVSGDRLTLGDAPPPYGHRQPQLLIMGASNPDQTSARTQVAPVGQDSAPVLCAARRRGPHARCGNLPIHPERGDMVVNACRA